MPYARRTSEGGAATAPMGRTEGHAVGWTPRDERTAFRGRTRKAQGTNSGQLQPWIGVAKHDYYTCQSGGFARMETIGRGRFFDLWHCLLYARRRRQKLSAQSMSIALVFSRNSCGRPNVLTLSCKNGLTCMPREAARRLPRLTPEWQERTAADVTRACSSNGPRRLAAGPADRPFLSACEGS